MNQNTKHTPGPWKASAYSHVMGCLIDTENERIAAVIPVDKAGDKTKANAALIAAAPELLEALQCIADNEEQYCECAPEYGWYGEGHATQCPCGIAQAAIAKAEGGAA